MEILRPMNNGGLKKRAWSLRRRESYQRSYSTTTNRRNTKVVRLGGVAPAKKKKRCFRVVMSRRKLLVVLSPVKLWTKFKNAYMNMMLHLDTNNHSTSLAAKRIPKARQVEMKLSNTEFDNRLIHEIYKSLSVSMELYNPN